MTKTFLLWFKTMSQSKLYGCSWFYKILGYYYLTTISNLKILLYKCKKYNMKKEKDLEGAYVKEPKVGNA